VSPSQKIKLNEMTPLFFTTHYQQKTMSHPTPRRILGVTRGPNGPFLRELFHNQSQLVVQLQVANNDLTNSGDRHPGRRSQCALPSHVGGGTNNPHQHASTTGGQSSRNAKAADPVSRINLAQINVQLPTPHLSPYLNTDSLFAHGFHL